MENVIDKYEARCEQIEREWAARFSTLEHRVASLERQKREDLGREDRDGVVNREDVIVKPDKVGNFPKVQVIRSVPDLAIMTGKNTNRRKIKRWIEQAEYCVEQLGIRCYDAVRFVCQSLQDPALTRVKTSKPKDLRELGDLLLEVYGERLDEFEVKREFWSARQEPRESMWEFLDRINELDEDVQETYNRNVNERERSKCTVFIQGLRNRYLAADLKQRMDDGKLMKLEEAGRFVSNRINHFRVDYKMQPTKQNERAWCWTCGEDGHISKYCERGSNAHKPTDVMYNSKSKMIGNAQRYTNADRQVYESVGDNVREKPKKVFEGNCWTCGETGHPFFKCERDKSQGPRGNRYGAACARDNRSVVREIVMPEEIIPENE